MCTMLGVATGTLYLVSCTCGLASNPSPQHILRVQSLGWVDRSTGYSISIFLPVVPGTPLSAVQIIIPQIKCVTFYTSGERWWMGAGTAQRKYNWALKVFSV
uniref:Putative secreted peptide n=1 Tax=Anopheles braziliensis TaxID=58242 RepID=A0A2M3ZW59_9DIPT